MKFTWTTFRVSNLEKSLTFYTETLGMRLDSRFGVPGHEIAMLGSPDGTKLELICDEGAFPEVPGQGVSVGFAPESLDALIAALKQHGIEPAGPISPNPNLRFFFVRDPDGYVIQLVEQKPQ